MAAKIYERIIPEIGEQIEILKNKFKNKKELKEAIRVPSPLRIFAIAQGLWKKTFSVEEIWEMTKIDRWFLYQIERITNHGQKLQKESLIETNLRESKKLGFSDPEIARLTHKKFEEIRKLRTKYKIQPVTKQIDTLAAEFPAQTNYLYTTYHGEKNDI